MTKRLETSKPESTYCPWVPPRGWGVAPWPSTLYCLVLSYLAWYVLELFLSIITRGVKCACSHTNQIVHQFRRSVHLSSHSNPGSFLEKNSSYTQVSLHWVAVALCCFWTLSGCYFLLGDRVCWLPPIILLIILKREFVHLSASVGQPRSTVQYACNAIVTAIVTTDKPRSSPLNLVKALYVLN